MANIRIKLLLFVFCCFCFIAAACAQTGMDFRIPTAPHGELLDTKELRMGNRQINTVLYDSDEDITAVSDYYNNFFQEEGFQKIFDKIIRRTNKRLLRFKRDELVVSIAVFVRRDRTNVVVAKYLQAPGEPSPEEMKPSVKDSLFALPKKDLPGADISGIPRPPESVRILSRHERGGATIMYTTALDVASTADFYRGEMDARGWAAADEISTREAVEAYEKASGKKGLGIKSPFSDGEDFGEVIRDSYVLNFNSSSSTVEIIVFPNYTGREAGSMVRISYSERQ